MYNTIMHIIIVSYFIIMGRNQHRFFPQYDAFHQQVYSWILLRLLVTPGYQFHIPSVRFWLQTMGY